MNAPNPNIRLLLTTLASDTEAKTLVRQLLEERLIACGTLISSAQSLYWWQGKIEESAEVILLLKTEEEIASRCMESLPWAVLVCWSSSSALARARSVPVLASRPRSARA